MLIFPIYSFLKVPVSILPRELRILSLSSTKKNLVGI